MTTARRGETTVRPVQAPAGTLIVPEPDPAHGTFVFADLVGFSALTEIEGDARAAAKALAFHESVRVLLAEHGAVEVKTIGDAIMLRVDEADRALRLGVRIVRALCDAGLPPVRVGMDTGWAIPLGSDWFGATVNRAARLCSAAGPNELLVSAATRAAAPGHSCYGFGREHRRKLKNLAKPVAAHRVVPLVAAPMATAPGTGGLTRRRFLHAV
jgi:adenylate cyclase